MLSGTPLASDPQAPLFYPPNLLFLFLPTNAAFVISSMLHIALGGVGMYFLARHFKIPSKWAMFALCAYILSPRLSAFIEAGHFGLIEATGWIPFVLLATLKLVEKPNLNWVLLLAISLTGTFYTHTTTFVYLTGISVGIFGFGFVSATKKSKAQPLAYLKAGLLTFGLTAIGLLPQMAWLPETTRYLLLSDRQVWPVWKSKFEFIWAAVNPLLGGKNFALALDTEKWIALGLVGICIAIYGYIKIPLRKKYLLAFALTPIALFGATNASPFFDLLLTQNWFVMGRVGTRTWFLVSVATVLLSAYGFSKLAKSRLRKFATPLAIVTLLELGLISTTWITKPVLPSTKLAAPNLLSYLDSDQDVFRVFCISRCLSQQTVVEHKLETIEGYSTLIQDNYNKQSWQLTGTYWDYYTLAIPPIGSYKLGNYSPDYQSLGDFNTKYIISPKTLDSDALEFIMVDSGYYLYRNLTYKPRVYSSTGEYYPKVASYFPDKIVVNVSHVSPITVAQVYNPGWRALDHYARKVSVQESPVGLISLTPETDGEITLQFIPDGYTTGKLITGVTMLTLVGYLATKVGKLGWVAKLNSFFTKTLSKQF